MPGPTPKPDRSHAAFVTTRWSVVRAANDPDPARAQTALEALCRVYWYPLYAYARRAGRPPADAEDQVQAFLAACVHKDYWRTADAARGRFRSFLLVAFKRFLANAWDKAQAQKRGGGQSAISLDALEAEARYALEPRDERSADLLYDRRWALTLLEQVLARLEEEQAAAGKAAWFAALKGHLTGDGPALPLAELARRLHASEGAVKVALHRLRRRYRDRLHAAIAETVDSPEAIEAERRHLLAALSVQV